jgi:genome maintenance exonuclease 1
MFNFIKLPELDFDLEAITTDSGRVYVLPNGEKYPSVTTVLSSYNKQAILEWRERVGNEEANKVSGRAARRGTRLHKLCEDYVNGELNELKRQLMMPFDKMMFRQVKKLLDENLNNIYCQEQVLYSEKLRIAGRVDCIGEWKGKLSIIDYKSSTKVKEERYIENYFMQCSAYSEMFEWLTGKQIDDIVVVIATEEEIPQVFERKKKDYIDSLNKYVGEFYKRIAV